MSLRYDGHLEVLIPPPTILDWTRSNVLDSKVNGRLMSSSYSERRQPDGHTSATRFNCELWTSSARCVHGSPEMGRLPEARSFPAFHLASFAEKCRPQ